MRTTTIGGGSDLEGPIQQAISGADEVDEAIPDSPGRIGIQVSEVLDLIRSQQRESAALRKDIRVLTNARRTRTRMEELLSPATLLMSHYGQKDELDAILAELSNQLGRQATIGDVIDWISEQSKALIAFVGNTGENAVEEGPLDDIGE